MAAVNSHSNDEENHYEADSDIKDTQPFGFRSRQRSSSVEAEMLPQDAASSSKEANPNENPSSPLGGEQNHESRREYVRHHGALSGR